MNSIEPQASSTTLTTMKIHPPLLAGTLLLVTLALHFMLPEERNVGWEQVIGLLFVAVGADDERCFGVETRHHHQQAHRRQGSGGHTN